MLEATLRADANWPAMALLAGTAPAFALPWRRTHPVLVTGLAFGAIVLGDVVALIGSGEPIEPLSAAYVLLLPYALFRWGGGREAVTGMAIVLVTHTSVVAISGAWSDLVVGPFFLALPGAIGAAVRYRRSSRVREADQIRLREREQLARELHDTVAHHVSAIAIRAQAGRIVAATRPEAAVEALEVIEEAASRTLTDLRALVGALRESPEEADLEPQRGVADLEARLAARPADRRPVGGRTRQPAAAGGRCGLPDRPGVDHQRDPPRARCQPDRRRDHRRPRLRAADRARRRRRQARARSPGYGLLGMRERAALLGGSLDARPDAGGLDGDGGAAAMSVRVLVADDQELVRTGLRMILDAQPGIEVVGEAAVTGARRS